jgi:hypothetical protein
MRLAESPLSTPSRPWRKAARHSSRISSVIGVPCGWRCFAMLLEIQLRAGAEIAH